MLFRPLQLAQGVSRSSGFTHVSVGVCMRARCLSSRCSQERSGHNSWWSLEHWPLAACTLGGGVWGGRGGQIPSRLHSDSQEGFKHLGLVP